jgi:preprotein translocase subunit YajC
MSSPSILLALAPPPGGEGSPFGSLILMGLIFAIFYFVLIMPMRTKQRNPGIYGQIVGVEDDAFLVRVDEKTRIKVLKSAVAGLQGAPSTTEKK